MRVFKRRPFLHFVVETRGEMELHDEAARHHVRHEGHPRGLARRGRRGVQAALRDATSGSQLHRQVKISAHFSHCNEIKSFNDVQLQVLERHECATGEAATRRHRLHVHRGVSF